MTSATSNLSIDRVIALFDKEGWKYEKAPLGPALRTGFSGIGLEINMIEPNLNVLTTVAVDSVKAAQFNEVLEWVERYNIEKAYPTVTAVRDEQRGITALAVTYSLPGYWERSDQQFSDEIKTGIQGVVVAAREFLEAFAPGVVDQLGK